MVALDIIRHGFLLVQLLALTLAADKINVTKEAFAITQKNCAIIKDQNTAPAIMFAAADLVVIGKSRAVGKTYGTGNTQYDITMAPHCILKGNTDLKELTVRNMGQGNCGATDVEKNDLMPYLFFLRATSDPKVFEALNLGAKRITEPSMVWSPVFTLFCTVTNKKVCTGEMCAKACNFSPMPQGDCIPYEQNVIDEIKKEQAKRKAMEAKMSTTPAPTKPPTTTSMVTEKMEKKTTTQMKNAEQSNVAGTPVPYETQVSNNKSMPAKAVKKVEGPGGKASTTTVNCFVMLLALIVSRLI